jgi:hypothetical protein
MDVDRSAIRLTGSGPSRHEDPGMGERHRRLALD